MPIPHRRRPLACVSICPRNPRHGRLHVGSVRATPHKRFFGKYDTIKAALILTYLLGEVALHVVCGENVCRNVCRFLSWCGRLFQMIALMLTLKL